MGKGIAIGIAVFVGFMVLVTGVGWFAQGNDFFMVKFFAPKYEQVRHDTFKQSQAYNDGMVQELDRMYRDYQAATPSQKDALADIAMHRFASYDTTKLPPYLVRFLDDLRTGGRDTVR